MIDHKPQELSSDSEDTLIGVQLHVVFLQDAKDLLLMLCMVGRLQTIDEHVIDIDLHHLANLVGEHLVDEALVGGLHILEAEVHDLVAIQA